jgi:heat shock protein HspQ
MATQEARFGIGQIVKHILLPYRGVIIDLDAVFQGTDDWYNKMTSGHPPKDKPWYLLLVHGSVHHAYAAESQLELEYPAEPIDHPELDYFFSDFQNGMYIPHRPTN